MNFLSKNKIGTVKLLSLDQVTSYFTERVDQPFEAPRGTKRLFDLVNPSEPQYRVAFYQALHDTLVAKDIDTASEIAYGKKRYRVVTLNGELIEQTGVASGGGKPRRGLMGDTNNASRNKKKSSVGKDAAETVEKLEKRQRDMKAKIEEISKDIDSCQQTISSLAADDTNNEINAFKEKYPVNKKAIQHRMLKYEEELKISQAKYEEAYKNKKAKEIDLQRLIENKDTSIEEQIDELDGKILQLQNEIDEEMGEEYVAAKEHYEQLQQKYDKQIETYIRAKSMKDLGEENLEKMMKSLEESKIKIEQANAKLKEYETEHSQLEEE